MKKIGKVSLEDLKKYTYYKTDEDFKYETPIYSNIKVGDEFLYEGMGVCKVTKLYDYPNTKSFCEVETKDNKKFNIQWYDEKFYNLLINWFPEIINSFIKVKQRRINNSYIEFFVTD